MKKVVSWMLVILMLISALPITLFAEASSQAILSIESAYVSPGETFDVKVEIKNNPGIVSANLRLTFDDGLVLVGATNGDAFSTLTYIPPKQLSSGGKITSNCQIAWTGFDIDDKDIKDGTVVTLTFELDESARIGENYDIDISSLSGDIVDKNLNSVLLTASGTVTAIDYMPGDVNSDKIINMLDVVILSRYIVDGCKNDPNGYAVGVNESACDVNADSSINMLDVVLISRYIVDDCKYVPAPDGYGVRLEPSGLKVDCKHNLKAFAAEEATCTQPGKRAYWLCTECNKYFGDANGVTQIDESSTKINAKGHSYSDKWSYDQTYHWHSAVCGHTSLTSEKAKHSFNDDNICSVCQFEGTPESEEQYSITYELFEYNQNKGDTYLPTAYIDNEENPTYYTSEDSLRLETPICAGYSFDGWYTIDGKQITQIEKGTNKNLILQARWSELEYDIVYKLFKQPIEDNIKDKYKTYTVSEGLVDMPNPDIYNFIFLGWYDDDGNEVVNIPIGTTGDIALNAYFISKTNLAKPIGKLGAPIIFEDMDEGVISFAYELGTVENVPLDEIWEVEALDGLENEMSREVTWSTGTDEAKTISETISDATVNSGTWSLSESWNDVVDVNSEWAQENSITEENENEYIKTDSNTYSLTKSKGGIDTKTTTDGKNVLTYDSKNTEILDAVEFDVNAEVGVEHEVSAGAKLEGIVDVGAKTKYSASVGAGVNKKDSTLTNSHTGTDTTKVDTTVGEDTDTWNRDETNSRTNTVSSSELVRTGLSQVVSESFGYGRSYAKGGEGSESFGSSTTATTESNSTSTISYNVSEGKTITETYRTTGKCQGKYRQIVTGTAHVFGVVGYDMVSKSYFTYTYSVMDDETDLLLDYAPVGEDYGEHEHSVLPFEIPTDIYEYVNTALAETEGLSYTTNSKTKTATVSSYKGSSSDVIIPPYMVSGGKAYQVTGISSSAFTGTDSNSDVRAVILSEYIDEIPAGAFKNCTKLEQISGYYTKIGKDAFRGCESLSNFNISGAVTEVGTNAFKGVPQITINALSSERSMKIAKGIVKAENPDADEKTIAELAEPIAKQLTQTAVSTAVKSGADRVFLNISSILETSELSIEVPEISFFKLNGDSKEFKNLTLVSNADSTTVEDILIENEKDCPLSIYSSELITSGVYVSSPYYALLLHYDGAELVLFKDTTLISENGKAVVCKNIQLFSEEIDKVSGTLDVTGNIYVCGKSGNLNENNVPYYVTISDGRVYEISENDFENYIKGSYKVNFNANGGTVGITEKEVVCGEALGTLPTPTRDYYTFIGWHTAAEGGTQVTEVTTLDTSDDVTLYAHWTLNEYSAWSDEEAPADIDSSMVKTRTVYSYRDKETTTNSSSSLDGWEKYDSKITSYGSKIGPVYTDPSNGSRKVTSEQYVASKTYKYYHRYGTLDSGNKGWGSDKTASGLARHTTSSSSAFAKGDKLTLQWYKGSKCEKCGSSIRWLPDGEPVENKKTRWYYQEPVYTYYYYRWLEWSDWSTEVVTESDSRQVQNKVQYCYIPR
ncbi:MAG: InlB B-repeat-containing protein [Clostridia bacterium]|nr:InlB B-repeat-containing protein [Clostridia bacterium]